MTKAVTTLVLFLTVAACGLDGAVQRNWFFENSEAGTSADELRKMLDKRGFPLEYAEAIELHGDAIPAGSECYQIPPVNLGGYYLACFTADESGHVKSHKFFNYTYW